MTTTIEFGKKKKTKVDNNKDQKSTQRWSTGLAAQPQTTMMASATIPKIKKFKKIQKNTTASAKILNGFGYKQQKKRTQLFNSICLTRQFCLVYYAGTWISPRLQNLGSARLVNVRQNDVTCGSDAP
jgi:hypothetical protein